MVCMHTYIAVSFAQNASQGTYATPALKEQAERETDRKGRVPAAEPEAAPGQDEVFTVPDLTGYMSLVSVEAVNIVSGYTPEQEKGFRTDAQSEFEVNDGKLSLDKGKLYFIKRTGNQQVQEFGLRRLGSQLEVVCGTCGIPPFTIVEETASRVILDIPSQDEDARFSYRYTFVK